MLLFLCSVTLKNLNYKKNAISIGDDVGDESNVGRIMNAIATEPKATQKRLSEMTGLSTRTISRAIKELRDTSILRRVGSARVGYWEMLK